MHTNFCFINHYLPKAINLEHIARGTAEARPAEGALGVCKDRRAPLPLHKAVYWQRRGQGENYFSGAIASACFQQPSSHATWTSCNGTSPPSPRSLPLVILAHLNPAPQRGSIRTASVPLDLPVASFRVGVFELSSPNQSPYWYEAAALSSFTQCSQFPEC